MIIKHFYRPLLSKNKQTGNFFMFFFSLKLLVVFVLDDHQTLFQALYVKKQAKMKFHGFFYQNHGFDKIQCGNFVNQYFVV